MNPATTAQRSTLWFAMSGFVLIVALVYFSLTPATIALPGDDGGHIMHAGAYTLLMFVLSRAGRGVRFVFLMAVALIALGVAIEFLQAQTGYRNFERADMLANAIGVACGWIAGLPLNVGIRNAQRKRR